jgi:ferredoxin
MEEDSPVPGKAMRERIQSKPTQERWDYVGELFVVAHLCTGCGVCEHFCPVGAEPGIVVNSNNEDREAVAVV